MSQTKTAANPVGIIALAYQFPPDKESVRDIFKNEGFDYNKAIGQQLGIEQVHVNKDRCKTNLALAAAKSCMQKSGISPEMLDVIIDFSVMPQDYVVPSWCISNQIQHELKAVNAFNIGFGGNNTTNLLVALQFVRALIKTGQVKTALLVATDIAIAGNRVIQGPNPLTVLSDGASALLVKNEGGLCEILDIEIGSDASRHNVFCIRGGGLAFPDREDLYKVQIDADKLDLDQAWRCVKLMSDKLLQKRAIGYPEISRLIFPAISAQDSELGLKTFGMQNLKDARTNLNQNGHIQATDININLLQLMERPHKEKPELGLVCSHGWGFSYGAMLVRY